MAIFGMQDLVLWWVGVAEVADLSPWRVGTAGAKGVHLRSGAMGGRGLRRRWRSVELVGGSGQWWWCSVGVSEREERGKIQRGKMWCFVLILICCNKLNCQLLNSW